MFWAIASVILFLAALITLLPLLRGKTFWQPTALALIFLIPAAALWFYQQVGTPDGIGLQATPQEQATQEEDIDAMVASLHEKLTESPQDLEGWMLLARTLKTLQRHPEAVEALETANRIAPDDPFVLVELVEAQIFNSGDGRIDEKMRAMLERALELQPDLQKALWLMGIASAQAGDDESAINYWKSLMQQLEPGSPIAQSLQTQIDEATGRLGLPIETRTPETVAWTATQLRISASDSLPGDIPAGAVLYVIIRTPGVSAGPPIGVRRINNPSLPVELDITDGDSMMQERKISAETEVSIQVRLSISGSPGAQPGDWQSPALTVELESSDVVHLVLDLH